jgi:hypothetical protein
MNRIQRLFDQPSECPPCGEFFVVAGEFGRVLVTREVAMALRASFQRLLVPTWLEFRDHVGSFIRVRSRWVTLIVESTPAQRAADRAFEKARSEEDDDNRTW